MSQLSQGRGPLDVTVSGLPRPEDDAAEVHDMLHKSSPARDLRFIGRELVLEQDDGYGNVIVLSVRGAIETRYWL